MKPWSSASPVAVDLLDALASHMLTIICLFMVCPFTLMDLIVWCHFPDNFNPRPKPRPALILAVFDDDAPRFHVQIAYGTSQRTTTLHSGEFSVLRASNRAAYEAAGLSYDTEFDLNQVIEPPYTTVWFSVPPAAPHGQTPKLGTLHPSLVPAVQAAYQAASD